MLSLSEESESESESAREMEEASTKKVVVEQESEDDMEKSIAKAMREREGHFKEQADSLTLEGVRRVLEKDLELETFALDVHKRFIKQCLQECFDGANDESVSKQSAETVKGIVQPGKVETTDLSEELQSDKKEKDPGSESDEKNRGSPVQGILDGEETAPNDTHEAEGVKTEKSLIEDNIKKALKKKASYFRENSESLTMAGVRRLLEEDLKLDQNTLDPYKKLISEQLDEIMQSSEPANGAKTKRIKKESSRKPSSDNSEGSSGSMDSEDEEANEEEVKPKRKNVLKGKPQNSKGLKNSKTPAKETTTSSNKRKRPAEPASEEGSDGKDSGNLSEDGNSQSSIEEPVKKKSQTSTQVYGKRVEHLKSVIKSCGMSIPPAIYKRAKQAPESKREAALIKELEEILKKEGLSTNPSEKEIKAVKKQKARTKELEGIDLSNIVQSSRRRSTSSFVPPPKPKVPVESDDEEEDEDEDEDEDDEEDSDDEVDADADSEGASEDTNEEDSD